MSDARRMNEGGAADEAAIRWFARLQDDAAAPEDWQAFEAWLAASPANAAAYERLERLWVDVEAPEVEAALAPPEVVRLKPRAVSRRGWLAAGGVLAAGLAAAVVGLETLTPEPAEAYATKPGETRLVRLDDGTRMRLNADSRVSVRLGRRSRDVELAEGEVAFDVTHDPARPFVIDVGDRDVRVVGTEFNLRRRDGEVALNVRRGLVEVRHDAGASPTVRVAAGQQFVHREGQRGGALSMAEPDRAFAWTEGQLVYEAAPLSRVAADLSRSLGTPVRVADTETGAMPFTGVLAVDDREAVLKRLEAFVPVRAERRPNGVVLHTTDPAG